ncbi:MAG TPA: MSEP-CTERM sorting domain-containing protein [Bacillota bacterium]|nr:MSEP-CTERM sorting domain-containing protein [Bacillota bacterium]
MFLSITLPQLGLLAIFWKLYTVIHPLLKENSIQAWKGFGASLILLWLGFSVYAGIRMITKKPVHAMTAILIFGTYISWMYGVLNNIVRIIPWEIPRWMLFWVAPELFLFTFLLPGLVYAMVLLIVAYTPEIEHYRPWRDLAWAIGIPAAWYLIFNVFLGVLRFGPNISDISRHIVPIALIVSTLTFLFLLGRLLYVLFRAKQNLVLKLITWFVMVMPVAGLALNRKLNNLFGDFSHPVYYILAIITGGLLILPAPDNKGLRLALYTAKSIVLPFTLYFFIVFLPFLPLAIPLILALGFGFLILTPLVLGFKHVLSLREDYIFLRSAFNKPILLMTLILASTIIPGGLYLMIREDNYQIQKALSYLYRTEYQTDHSIDLSQSALKRAIKNLKMNKMEDTGVGFGFGERTPYLTSIYNWLVLNNLTLADDKLQALERVYFGEVNENTARVSRQTALSNKPVHITNIKSFTRFDQHTQTYLSKIDLELQNSVNSDRQEFTCSFELPTGCYITGYYLDVNGERKQGNVVDKRAAVWVYQQIRNVQKDPGILIYRSGKEINLRVFPFEKGEKRYTGLELVHRLPIALKLDDHTVQLGDSSKMSPIVHSTKAGAFISRTAKQNLVKIHRRPVYYFLLDYSMAADGRTSGYIGKIRQCLQKYQWKDSDIYLVPLNYNLKVIPMEDQWQSVLDQFPVTGGFFLDRGLKTILYQHYRSGAATYPVMIVVTDKLEHLRLYEDYKLWEITFPETDAFYRLGERGELYQFSLLNREGEGKETDTILGSRFVLGWPRENPRVYLPDDHQDSLILYDDAFSSSLVLENASLWETGLSLELMSLGLSLNPSNYHQRELAIIRESMEKGVMSRHTSYVVLENAAQEKALREKQQQILSAKKIVDVSNVDHITDTDPEMVEPSIVILLILGGCILLFEKQYFIRHGSTVNRTKVYQMKHVSEK